MPRTLLQSPKDIVGASFKARAQSNNTDRTARAWPAETAGIRNSGGMQPGGRGMAMRVPTGSHLGLLMTVEELCGEQPNVPTKGHGWVAAVWNTIFAILNECRAHTLQSGHAVLSFWPTRGLASTQLCGEGG